jgi:hypothetical protein
MEVVCTEVVVAGLDFEHYSIFCKNVSDPFRAKVAETKQDIHPV